MNRVSVRFKNRSAVIEFGGLKSENDNKSAEMEKEDFVIVS